MAAICGTLTYTQRRSIDQPWIDLHNAQQRQSAALVESLARQGIKAYPAASGCAVCFETTPPTYYHPTLGKL